MAAIIPPLKYIAVPAIAKHTATVIFVHGLGDTGHGWEPVADIFQKEGGLNHIKWVFPHAPAMPVKANMNLVMPAWFDIYSFDFNDTQEDAQGMQKTAYALNQLITAEIAAGIPASRIILGGFSQGGAISLLTGMTTERRLAGIAVLSGWLPLRHEFRKMTSAHASTIPIFWGHGKADPLVQFKLGRMSVEWLTENLKVPITQLDGDVKGLAFNAYDGVEHATNAKELDDLKGWIKRVLPQD